jgi:hypothetical protein
MYPVSEDPLSGLLGLGGEKGELQKIALSGKEFTVDEIVFYNGYLELMCFNPYSSTGTLSKIIHVLK